MPVRISAITAVCALALLAGCGEDPPPATPPRLKPPRNAGTPEIQVRTARTDPRGAAPDVGESEAFTPARRPVTPLDPETDPADLFVIADGPNFEIIDGGPGPHAADVFFAVRPEQGSDSSNFIVVEPGAGPLANQPRADFELPDGFEAVAAAGYSPDGLPRRIVCEADGAELVLVSGGVSLLGTVDGPSETRPQIDIHLADFYIGATEVTLDQYERYLRDRRAQVVRLLEEPLNKGAPGDHPALGLSWGAARDYARWAGQELPTEAQWEKAARGPTGFAHPWGNGRTVFHRARTQSQIDPVGSFPLDRSPFGALDLAGNAREWCLDFYSDRAFAEAADSGQSPLTNWQGPRRPSAESQRVIKGNGPEWKVWHREGLSMAARRPDMGFRCVLELERVADSAEQPDASDSDSARSPMRGSRSRRRP